VVSYAWLDLPEVRREQFDTDDYLLGLPGGLVADLHSGAVRQMQRDDYVSRCLTVAPDASHPTPRWTRFLLEIACGTVTLRSIYGGCAPCVSLPTLSTQYSLCTARAGMAKAHSSASFKASFATLR
jgi:hypothetical protein